MAPLDFGAAALPGGPLLTFRTQFDDSEAAVVHLSGELDYGTAQVLSDTLDAVAATRVRTIDVDMAEVSFVDSAGIAVVRQHATDTGARVCVVRPSPAATRLIDLTGQHAILR